jgi:anti-sigma factor RsiW
MTGRDIDWETLNAYVDGELDAERAAEVARAAANEPGIARQLSTISQLKAATAASAEPMPAIDLPRRARPLWPRVAAGMAIVMVGGLAALFALYPASQEESWLVSARADHAEWATTGRIGKLEALNARTYLAGLHRLGPAPYLPDLSSARLKRESVRYIPAGDRQAGALHAGYVGTRGCRISLWVTVTEKSGFGPLTQHPSGSGPAYSWHAGRLRYVLLSSGMDVNRFALIAEAAHRATGARSIPDDETRTALTRSRKTSPPCRA